MRMKRLWGLSSPIEEKNKAYAPRREIELDIG